MAKKSSASPLALIPAGVGGLVASFRWRVAKHLAKLVERVSSVWRQLSTAVRRQSHAARAVRRSCGWGRR